MKMKRILAAMLAGLCAASLCACGGNTADEPASPVNFCLIAGLADGEPLLQTVPELNNLVSYGGSPYALISAEGTPQLLTSGKIPDFSDSGYTQDMLRRVQNDMLADLTGKLNDYNPISGEIDMAAALEQGARQLQAHRSEGCENILALFCTGRSTKGLIDMTQTPPCRLDAAASAEVVAQKMNADLSDTRIVWYCCGDGSSPAFSADEKTALKEFYTALFVALGAEAADIDFRTDLPSDESYSRSQSVSPIEAADVTSGLQPLSDALAQADDTALLDGVRIQEEQVHFLPDSAEFQDPEAAAAALEPIAAFLLQHPDVDIVLYGTCAGDGNSDFTQTLSRSRAEAVKAALGSAGVEEARMTCLDVSCEQDIYYAHGLGTGSEAAVNRKVVVMDARAEFARQLLAQQ